MPEVAVPPYAVSSIYISRDSWVFCLLFLCSLMMCANSRGHYEPMVIFICLYIPLPHYHHYSDLSEIIELLKCSSDTFCLKCVSKIKSILSIILHAIHGAVRIQLTHFSYSDYENMCTLAYHHHQIGNMTHIPLFRVRLWNSGMCWMYFYIFIRGTQIHQWIADHVAFSCFLSHSAWYIMLKYLIPTW